MTAEGPGRGRARAELAIRAAGDQDRKFGHGLLPQQVGHRPVGVIYLIIGIVIAWNHGYLNADLLRKAASALLAIFLWVLVLLGVDLHITG